MARYVNRIPVPVDPASLMPALENFLRNEGFQPYDYKGEAFWKKGTGMATAPQLIRFLPGPGYIEVQALIKYALLPGVYVGEMGITGFFGAVPKNLLKARVMNAENYLRSLYPQQGYPQPQ